MTVNYPDNTIETVEGTKQGEIYVATVRGCPTPGVSGTGYSVIADGTDENGVERTGFVLGKGEVVVLDKEGELKPGERSFYMRLRDEEPENPHKGDVVRVEGGARYYDGEEWVDFAEVVDSYTKGETDELIDGVRDEIPTKVSELENDSGYLTEHQSLDECVKVTGGTMTGTLTAQNGITVSKGELVVGAAAALRVNKKTIKSGYGQSEIMVNLPDSSGTLALKSDLDEYAKSEDIPTKVSELENDSGYLTQHQSLAGYLPLSGGTMTGNITFTGARHLVFGDNPLIEAIYGLKYYLWRFPSSSGTLALDKDVQELKADKVDAEEEEVVVFEGSGLFDVEQPKSTSDAIVTGEGGTWTERRNAFRAVYDDDDYEGYTVTCTACVFPSKPTLRNLTRGTSATGLRSLFFYWGDHGQYADGDDEDLEWIDFWVYDDLTFTETKKLSIGESIEKRLQGIEEELEDFTDWKESDRTTIGKNAVANDEECVAVGAEAQAKYRSASIGYRAFTSSSYAVAIGNESEARFGAVAVGSSAKGYGNNSTAIGDSSSAGGASSVVVGVGATTSDAATGSVQLGQGTCTTSNTLKFKNTVVVDSGGKIPAGSLSVSEQLGNLEPLPSNASLTDVVTRLNAILAALKG